MTDIEGAEAAGGRLGAVLSAPRDAGPVLLGRDGPWLVTSQADARHVLAEPADFDFPGHVARGTDLSGSTGETRSGHTVFAPTTAEDVARGMAVFAGEWQRAVSSLGQEPREASSYGSALDAMQALRRPVARSTVTAVLPDVALRDRDSIADLVLAWIDALAPVISAPHPPRRWSGVRRRERAASTALEQALAAVTSGTHTPQELATMLAAGIQVPVAAGAWLLVWLAAHPDRAGSADHAVWETLRLTPPTWVTARVAARDVQLGQAQIASGSLVLVSPLLLGRLADLVPGAAADLAEFTPERWATPQVRPGAWLPFGAGPHACPGRTLGLAMLRHLATWAIDHPLELAHSVAIDQGRGIFPSPALVRHATPQAGR